MAGAACAVGKLSFWPAVIIAAASYALGSLVPYYIGYNIPRLQNLPWVGRFVESSLRALDQVNALFRRHGEKAVALFRPFWIGNLISYFAGLNRMPYYRFLSYTFIGISAWSVTVIFLGQVFSTNLPKAAALIKHYSGIAFVLLIVISVLGWRLAKIWHARQGLPAVRD
jgi:membrane protein DedA with SNARE-associated domain